MVRFSDMLGGDGDTDDARAKTAPRDDLPPALDDAPDPDAPSAPDLAAAADAAPVDDQAADTPAPAQSAQDLLDRLTQYATASRAADPDAPVTRDPSPAPSPTPAVAPSTEEAGDDILPRGKRSLRNPRGPKRAT